MLEMLRAKSGSRGTRADQGVCPTDSFRSQECYIILHMLTTRLREAAAALLAVGALLAQPAPDWIVVKALAPGSEVRVETPAGKLTGLVQAVSDGGITLLSGKGAQTAMRSDVTRVAVKKPSHRKRNALIGLAAGAAFGLVGESVATCNPADYSRSCPSQAALDTAGALVFGGMGAAVGAVIPTGGWREIYRSPAAAQATSHKP